MIRELDQSLENLIKGEAPSGSALSGATISFGAPDQTWRQSGTGLILDVYLYQLLENRQLRSNERMRRPIAGGGVTVEPFPARVECSYLLTAWNKATGPTTEEKELEEHRLLSQALYVLLRNPTLPDAYLTPTLAAAQDLDLPSVTAQADGPATGVDFWTGLGTYLRPSVTCKVTVALILDQAFAAPAATWLRLHIDGDERSILGGVVRDSAVPPAPVAGAWVRVDETGEVAVTDDVGRFRLERITAGTFTLTIRATGFREATSTLDVPAASGAYEVALHPL